MIIALSAPLKLAEVILSLKFGASHSKEDIFVF